MKIIYQKVISREDCRANPNCVYLFGDNLERRGLGGQAASMRGEPNAIGIPTKHSPSMDADAFFTDAEFVLNCKVIDYAFASIPKDKIVVVPLAGLGTGLAKMEAYAPRTFEYLQSKLKDLEAE